MPCSLSMASADVAHDSDTVWRAWMERRRTAGISMGLERSSGLGGGGHGYWSVAAAVRRFRNLRCSVRRVVSLPTLLKGGARFVQGGTEPWLTWRLPVR